MSVMKWWVSGATGSWGREIVKQLLALPSSLPEQNGHPGLWCDEIVAYCRGEYRAFELKQAYPDPRLRIYLGDIRDRARVHHSLRGITHVIHAAAMKRIDAATISPTEMHDVNVTGTQSILDACLSQGVRRAFYISTDKACEPTTFYGATKLVAEQLWLSANDLKKTAFDAMRFGNALDSTGSVLQVWRKQIEADDPVTVRSLEMTRFVMTVQWGVQQILRQWEGLPRRQLAVPLLSACTLGSLVLAFCGRTYPLAPQDTLPGEKDHEKLLPGLSSATAPRLGAEDLQVLMLEGGIVLPPQTPRLIEVTIQEAQHAQ